MPYKTNIKVLAGTQSVCPQCLKRIPANYIIKKKQVYMHKSCDEHGFFETLLWEDVQHWKNWTQQSDTIRANATFEEPSNSNCPYDCGICSNHLVKTCCVLMEVTARCNLRCPVCFASSKTEIKPEPSLECIHSWYDMLLEQGGPFNIQLSGGEPSLRDDLPKIIHMGRQKGFDFFQINTNGIRLATDEEYLKKLVDAGLNTVFLQFDGFRSQTYLYLRGQELLNLKLQCIQNCKKHNIGVVLVPTIQKALNDGEAWDIIKFAFNNMPTIRGVHFQPMSFFGRYSIPHQEQNRMTLPSLLQQLEQQSEGKIKIEDFKPGAVEHALCSFHADYVLQSDGNIKLVNLTNSNGCDKRHDEEPSQRARKVVARKWRFDSNNQDGKDEKEYERININSLDEFLWEKTYRTLAISGMVFQDAWNLDTQRLQRCYIHEISNDGTLVPFCAYNLSSIDGKYLYRNN